MKQPRFILALVLLCACGAAAAADSEDRENPGAGEAESPGAGKTEDSSGWSSESRLEASQWVGSWLISRDGEARHVWSLRADGKGRSYAFLESDGEMRFAYGYDIRWYFDPYTQMAHIKTERRLVCRGGRVYPYFLTLKSYESDYAVKGKFAWQTTWTEASIGRNHLHKSLVVFVAPLSAWHDPQKDAPCPEFPRVDLEKDIDLALERWTREARRAAAAEEEGAQEESGGAEGENGDGPVDEGTEDEGDFIGISHSPGGRR